jgi:hypothetical protein
MTTDPPTFALSVGADSATFGAVVSTMPAGPVTVSAKVVVRTTPETTPLMTIVEVPTGVVGAVKMVRVVEQGGEQDVGEKIALAPAGSPDTLNGTSFVTPDVSTTVIVFHTDEPPATVRLPALASAKLNDPVAAFNGYRVPRAAKINDVSKQMEPQRRTRLDTRERTSPLEN